MLGTACNSHSNPRVKCHHPHFTKETEAETHRVAVSLTELVHSGPSPRTVHLHVHYALEPSGMWLESPQQLQNEPPRVRASGLQLSWDGTTAVRREGRGTLLSPGRGQQLCPEPSGPSPCPSPGPPSTALDGKAKNNGIKCVYQTWTRPTAATLVSFALCPLRKLLWSICSASDTAQDIPL